MTESRRDGRLHRADIERGHYEYNAGRICLHRRFVVIAYAGYRGDWVCDLGLSGLFAMIGHEADCLLKITSEWVRKALLLAVKGEKTTA